MNRDLIGGIGAGAIGALLWASVTTGAGGGLLIAYIAPLPLLAVGLSLGSRAAGIAAIAGTIIAGIAGNGLFGAMFGVMIGLPVWFMVRMALMNRTLPTGAVEWFPMGHILARMAGFGAALIVAAGIVHFDADGGLQGAVGGYLDQILQARFAVTGPLDTSNLIEQLVPLFPALIASSWILLLIINSVLAQVLVKRAGKNLRSTPSYARLDIPDWAYWTIVAAAAVSLIGDGNLEYLARNVVMVMAVPFFFVGVGIAHILVRRLPTPGVGLVGFYLMLLFFGWTAIAVAAIGFLEQWTDLKGRYGGSLGPNPRTNEEDE